MVAEERRSGARNVVGRVVPRPGTMPIAAAGDHWWNSALERDGPGPAECVAGGSFQEPTTDWHAALHRIFEANLDLESPMPPGGKGNPKPARGPAPAPAVPRLADASSERWLRLLSVKRPLYFMRAFVDELQRVARKKPLTIKNRAHVHEGDLGKASMHSVDALEVLFAYVEELINYVGVLGPSTTYSMNDMNSAGVEKTATDLVDLILFGHATHLAKLFEGSRGRMSTRKSTRSMTRGPRRTRPGGPLTSTTTSTTCASRAS
jgi:hypothetical protein